MAVFLKFVLSYTGYIEHFILILRKFTAHIDKGSVGEDDVGRDRFFLGNLETELPQGFKKGRIAAGVCGSGISG